MTPQRYFEYAFHTICAKFAVIDSLATIHVAQPRLIGVEKIQAGLVRDSEPNLRKSRNETRRIE